MELKLWSRLLNSLLLIAGILLAPQIFAQTAVGTPISLDELIALASKKSESLQALDKSIQALEADVRSRDLELSAQFSTELAQVNDHRQNLTNTQRFSDSRFMDLTLTKPFSTGTAVEVTASHTLTETNLYPETRSLADWNVRLTQSLWRNGFGQATRLRQQSDAAELQGRKFELEAQKQAQIIDLENLYWDLVLALKEEEIRAENIKRSETLESWTRRRVSRSAAEKSDILQVEALSSDRRLDLIETKNRISVIRNQLEQIVPGLDSQTFQPLLKSLEADRSLSSLIHGSQSEKIPKRLDYLANVYLAEEARLDSRRINNSLKPVLDAYVGYGRNGVHAQGSEAWQTASRENFYGSEVGVLFTIDLDQDLKNERRRSSKLQAEAQMLKAQASERSSSLEWSDLERNLLSLREQAKESKKLAQFQKLKSDEERKRYQLGRSTVFQLVTFEVDSAEAELRYYRTLAALRKAEARARVFTTAEGQL